MYVIMNLMFQAPDSWIKEMHPASKPVSFLKDIAPNLSLFLHLIDYRNGEINPVILCW
jgi:hypothetical protein